ncbi:hypothetical protein ARAM_003719 [Aspergillus rambellii]|uniref:Hemerythrin-like domain-containing protein n=1 Tax=Aspergillus rambellii TaxID=308745 RepID=A0A0F8V1Q9_9EURO|nr:hypothetical protein ARAM_003719 [Aspergillus rambellii]
MPPNITEAIRDHYTEIQEWYGQIIQSDDGKTQAEYQKLFTWELARHCIAKEIVLFPAFEKYLPHDALLIRKSRQGNQKVKKELKIFQKMKTSNGAFIPAIEQLMRDLSRVIREEETWDLPKLEDTLPSSESAALYELFGKTRIFIPMHCHHSAPEKPPFETAIGLLTAPTDQLVEALDNWWNDSSTSNSVAR